MRIGADYAAVSEGASHKGVTLPDRPQLRLNVVGQTICAIVASSNYVLHLRDPQCYFRKLPDELSTDSHAKMLPRSLRRRAISAPPCIARLWHALGAASAYWQLKTTAGTAENC